MRTLIAVLLVGFVAGAAFAFWFTTRVGAAPIAVPAEVVSSDALAPGSQPPPSDAPVSPVPGGEAAVAPWASANAPRAPIPAGARVIAADHPRVVSALALPDRSQTLAAARVSAAAGDATALAYVQRVDTQNATLGRRAYPLVGLRWLQGAAPDPDTPVIVLVFLGIGEVFTKSYVPELARRVERLRDDGVVLVGLAKSWKPRFDDLGPAAMDWLADNDIRFPVAEYTPALNTVYAIRGFPYVRAEVHGVLVWQGHPGALTDDLLDRLVGLSKDPAYLRDVR